jgi:two-component system, cell cycle sensor histidine kinase and response regulator CckA
MPSAKSLSAASLVAQPKRNRGEAGEPGLRESEEPFRKAFDQAAIGMAMTRPDGSWMKVNAALCDLLGYRQEELLDRQFLSLSHPEEREADAVHFRDLLASDTDRVQLERRFLHRDGRFVWVALTIAVVRDERGTALYTLAQIQDITERKRAEQELRDSEALLRGAFDDAPIGMALSGVSGQWVRVNQALCEIVGYSESELLATTFQAITDPDDLAQTVELHRQLLAGERTRYQFDKRYVHRLGHSVWVSVAVAIIWDEEGKPRHLLAQIKDVTERVTAEETRRRQTEMLEAILDHIPAMITVVGADGHLVFANGEWSRVSGWTLEEARELDVVAELYPSREEQARVLDFLKAAARSPGDFQMRTRDGRLLETTWSCVARSDQSVVGIGQDVTHRRHLEAQLRQAQKMEAVGRLAGGVAHDFNNLLTVIQTNASFLLADIDMADPRRRDVLQIRDAGDRAAGLTRQLLAYSRQQILQPRLVDVNLKVANVAAMLRRVIGEDIFLETDLAPTVWPVFADPGQLEQVLMNLAVNARDAMPHGGTLRLRTAMMEIDDTGTRTCPGLVPGQYASMVVEDTGVGIASDVLPQIFEPFYTTKGLGKGTGLGLSTVYGIVKQSGGHIHVDSVPGKGSRFTVLLPRHVRSSSDEENMTEPVVPRGTERILVVEDEIPVRVAVRRMLERLGYRVREAGNGAEALGMLDTSIERIDLILTDVVMPDVDGRLLGECVVERSNAKAPRVLYMSGYTDDDILRRGLAQPGIALLQKPFTLEALARAVREILDGLPSARTTTSA